MVAVPGLIMCLKSSSFESLPTFWFIFKKHKTAKYKGDDIQIVAYVKPNYIERFSLCIGYRCAAGLEVLTPVPSLSAIVLTKTVFKVQRV